MTGAKKRFRSSTASMLVASRHAAGLGIVAVLVCEEKEKILGKWRESRRLVEMGIWEDEESHG